MAVTGRPFEDSSRACSGLRGGRATISRADVPFAFATASIVTVRATDSPAGTGSPPGSRNGETLRRTPVSFAFAIAAALLLLVPSSVLPNWNTPEA